MLIVTYGCFKDKHNFYIGPTSYWAKMVSHVTVIGRGQVFQLLKSSWAIFYRGREFSSSALARMHYTKLYSLLPGTHWYHLQKQEPCLPSASPCAHRMNSADPFWNSSGNLARSIFCQVSLPQVHLSTMVHCKISLMTVPGIPNPYPHPSCYLNSNVYFKDRFKKKKKNPQKDQTKKA